MSSQSDEARDEARVGARGEALRLFRGGQVLEAERACLRRLEDDPDDLDALKVVAIAALRRGDAVRAVAKLTRVARLDPADTIGRYHLARAHEMAGNGIAALAWYDTTLRHAPDFHLARLNYGAALERAGQRDRALWQWARALRDAQAMGRWVDADATPSGLRPLVGHAVARVRAGRRAMLARVLEPLAARHGHLALARVERALRIWLGEESGAAPDAAQQPGFLWLPDLPAVPVFERTSFEWVAGLEAATPAIRAELGALLGSSAESERVFGDETLERAHLRGTHGAPSWHGFYFYRHGERRGETCRRCPATSRAVDALPLSRVPGHGPEVLFSVFAPGTHLLPHRGVTNTRLVGHLPLIVPHDCALRVGAVLHAWREGEVVVFDDTFEHEAWNRSSAARVVLIFDIWNPHLTAAERDAIGALVPAIGEFRAAVDAA
ncbi:MAG: aspartyl/asparaginyl beta-hydroxylase domain-containing protein [Steroidobacteraceae bacterium]